MGAGYRLLFDHVLTRTDPEDAHHLAFGALRKAAPLVAKGASRKTAIQAMGIDFPEVLGLAAGFDKNGEAVDALAGLGFGFVEIGTVTALPQPGNPKPRLARLPRDRAIVNRMGFNNDGAEAVARRLATRKKRLKGAAPVLGINIGKSKVVPEEDEHAVLADYRTSTRLLAPYADYLVVNVSSPNTPGLRSLQAPERLRPLLEAVRAEADVVTDAHVPLLVKIAPDLDDEDIVAVAYLALELGLDGIVATNTTIGREGLVSPAEAVEKAGGGGLSGAPLRKRANDVMRLLRQTVGHDLTLVGVGGIGSVEDAQERLEAGADLLQAYSALIYEGPTWPRKVNAALTKKGLRR